MGYNVQLGSGGYLGWKILERTGGRQREALSNSPSEKASKDYFAQRSKEIKSADDLIGDYKSLKVVLRAFGLDADINNKFFLKKVLEADPTDKSSLVSRLSDKRYMALNLAMKFNQTGEGGPIDTTAIISKYVDRSFEKNIGQRYSEIELALNAQRELPVIAASGSTENAKWFQILGSKPLRQIFETAYGLGSSFSAIPIDRQLTIIKQKTKDFTGSENMSQFGSPESLDATLRRYLLHSQVNSALSSSAAANAVTLLKS